ncbi:conserved hypothetical protein [Neospora caninum Liverpool]|uniref:PGAP1 family protein n=1 Tax=Neospora caninum (strain Liverpool) TaxID=572307 RepID=F0VEY1_NEOCL|nr:conserved hypothetical protein [Neospora caninum Liverpool]CBZ52275.1 conserved hypothetical protein [Neospora caninum Liverpool]CEL66243.1 TPA: PGAP1 family protein [Neospora caninum Liverpool]|eukprot:XP_003882307.1 conserved hypothetical protein [Neospora caninum Liverpool]
MGVHGVSSSRLHSGTGSRLSGSSPQTDRTRGGLTPSSAKPGARSDSSEKQDTDEDLPSEDSWSVAATQADTEADTHEPRHIRAARKLCSPQPPHADRRRNEKTNLRAGKDETSLPEREQRGLTAPLRRTLHWLRQRATKIAFYVAIFAVAVILLSGLSPYYHGNHTRNLVRGSGRFPRVPLPNSHYGLLLVKLTGDQDPTPDFTRPINRAPRERPETTADPSNGAGEGPKEEEAGKIEYHPVLVVPGHRGDWRQVLPLGKILHDVAQKRNSASTEGNEADADEATEHHFFGTGHDEDQQRDDPAAQPKNSRLGRKTKVVYHVYVVDFHREPSAFHPAILDKQAEFVIQCIEKLQSLYVPAPTPGASPSLGPPLTLVGHSLGGTVVMRVLSKRGRIRSRVVDASKGLSESPGKTSTPSQCEPDLSSFSFLTTVLLSSPVGGHPFIQLSLPYRFFYRRLWQDFAEQFGVPVSKAAFSRARAAAGGASPDAGRGRAETYPLRERPETKPCLPSTTFLFSVVSGWIDEFVVPPSALPPLFRYRFSWKAPVDVVQKKDGSEADWPGGRARRSRLHFFPLLLPFSRDVHTRHTHDNLMWSRPPLLFVSHLFREQARFLATLRDAEQNAGEAHLAASERVSGTREDSKRAAQMLTATPDPAAVSPTPAAVRLSRAWAPLARRMVQRVDTLTVSPFATFLSPWVPPPSLASLKLLSTASSVSSATTPAANSLQSQAQVAETRGTAWEDGLSVRAVPVTASELETRLQTLVERVLAKARRCDGGLVPGQSDSQRVERGSGNASCGVQIGGTVGADTGLYRVVSSLSELASQPIVSPAPVVLFPLVAGARLPKTLADGPTDPGTSNGPSRTVDATSDEVGVRRPISAFPKSLFFGLKPSPLAPFQRSSEGDDYNEAALPLCRRQLNLEKNAGLSGESLDESVSSQISKYLDRLLARLEADNSLHCSSSGSCTAPSKVNALSASESDRAEPSNRMADSNSSHAFSSESLFPFALFVASPEAPALRASQGTPRFFFRFLPPSVSLFYPARACGWLLPPAAVPIGSTDPALAPAPEKLPTQNDASVLILLNMNARLPSARGRLASDEVAMPGERKTGMEEDIGLASQQSADSGMGPESLRSPGASVSLSPLPSSVSASFSASGAPLFQLSFSSLPFAFTKFLSYFPSVQFLLSLLIPMSVRIPLATLTSSSSPSSLLSTPSYLLLPSPSSLAFFFPYQYTTRVEFVRQPSASPHASLSPAPAAFSQDSSKRMYRILRALCRQLDVVLVAWEQPEAAAAALSGSPEVDGTPVSQFLYRGSGAQQQKFSMKEHCFLREGPDTLARRWGWPSGLAVEAVDGRRQAGEKADGTHHGVDLVTPWASIFQSWRRKQQFLDAESSPHIFAPRYMPPNATACTSEAKRREWREEEEIQKTFRDTSCKGDAPREEGGQRTAGTTEETAVPWLEDAKFIRDNTTPVLLLPLVHVDDASFSEELEDIMRSAEGARTAPAAPAAEDGESGVWTAELVVEATGSMLSFFRILLNLYISVFVAFLVSISCLLLVSCLLTPLSPQVGSVHEDGVGLPPGQTANSALRTTGASSGCPTNVQNDRFLAALQEGSVSVFRNSIAFRVPVSCGLLAVLSVVLVSYSHVFFAYFCHLHPRTDTEALAELSPSLVSSFLVPPSSYLLSMQASLPPLSLLFVLLGLAGAAFWLMLHVGRAICRILHLVCAGFAYVTAVSVSSLRARSAESEEEESFVGSLNAKRSHGTRGSGSTGGEKGYVVRKRKQDATPSVGISMGNGVASGQGSEKPRAADLETQRAGGEHSVGVWLVWVLASFLLRETVRQPHQAALIMFVIAVLGMLFLIAWERRTRRHATRIFSETNKEEHSDLGRGSEGRKTRIGIEQSREESQVTGWDLWRRRRCVLVLLWWQLLMCLLLDALPMGLAFWRLVGLHETAEGRLCQVADENNSLTAAMAESLYALRQTELDDSRQVWRLGLWVLSPSLQTFPISDVSDEFAVRYIKASSFSDRFNAFVSILRQEESLFQALSMCLALVPAIWLLSWLLLQLIQEKRRREKLSANAIGEGFGGAAKTPLAVKVQTAWQVVAALTLPTLAFWLSDGMQMVLSVNLLLQCIVFSLAELHVPACS